MKNFEQDFTLPPFPAFPSASRYVPVGPVLDAVSRVSRSVLAREAISLIIGPPGTGKSLACSLLAKEFSSTHDVIVIGETSIVDGTAFYRFLLHRLGLALEKQSPSELELLVHQRLCGEQAAPEGAVLIVDEAASLTADVLEAIRRLTNLMREGQPMVSAVVVGGVKLDETLTAPSLEPFVQRVTARCYLHPLNAEETRHYIRESIQACDASPDETITDSAISAIHHATAGIPRLINQLVTEAIDCAAEKNESLIDDSIINQAWASLQQLPGPLVDEPSIRPESSTVEFGELQHPMPVAESPKTTDAIRSVSATDSADAQAMETVSERETFAHLVPTQESAIESPAIEPQESADTNACCDDTAFCRQPVSAMTDPIKLFGEFDDEENLDIGASQLRSARPMPADLDLETMLHSQIVSLSQFASENTASHQRESDPFSILHGNQDQPIAAENSGNTFEDAADGKPSVVWYDEPGAAEDATMTEPMRDDSDLLWITEDVDVNRRHEAPSGAIKPHRVDPPAVDDAPKLNVDYREMLEKMRNQA